jgi:hypothetical protein
MRKKDKSIVLAELGFVPRRGIGEFVVGKGLGTLGLLG